MDKRQARIDMVLRRKQVPEHERRQKSLQVARRVQAAVDWQSVSRLHVYVSKVEWGEIDTGWVRPYLQAAWPHIDVVTGGSGPDAPLPTGKFDVVLVPLTAFDERLYRLGMGAGWYDRFLAANPDAVSIGLAYEFQRTDRVPIESHDVPLAMIVTEERCYAAS